MAEMEGNPNKLRRLSGGCQGIRGPNGEVVLTAEAGRNIHKLPNAVTGIDNKKKFQAQNLTNTVTTGSDNTITNNITNHYNQQSFMFPPERIEFNIQECVPTFTGREGFIEDLHHDLIKTGTDKIVSIRSRAFVICGMAGVGKTQTIRKYIEQHKKSYDHLIWINSESYSEATSCFHRIAGKISISLNSNSKPKSDEDILDEIFDFLCRGFALIVYDNVGPYVTDYNNSGLHRLLPRAIKTGWKAPAIVVTTRNRNWTNFTVRELTGFNFRETSSLLSVLKITNNKEVLVEEISSLCQGLPLGLQQVISLVQHKIKIRAAISQIPYTLSDFFAELKMNRKKFLSTEPLEPESSDVPKNLFTIIEMTFEEIAKTKCGALALQCLLIMGHLIPGNIPTILLRSLVNGEDDALAEALSLLHDLNLVTNCGGFYQIHRLIQAITLESTYTNPSIIDGYQKNIMEEIVTSLTAFLESMPINCGQVHEILDNSIRIYDLASPENKGNSFLEFLNLLSTRLNQLGSRNVAIKICQHAVDCSQHIWGVKHSKTIKSQELLGNALTTTGKFEEARKLFNNVLQLNIELLGHQHEQTINTKHNLAEILNYQGSYVEAESLYQSVLQMRTVTLGPEHPNTLKTKQRLGLVLDYLGKYEQAEQLYNDVLQSQTKTLGSENHDTIMTKHYLARLLIFQGKYQLSEKLHHDALESYIKVLGTHHPDTLTAKHNLALVLDKQGKYEESKQLNQEVLQIKIRIQGPNHPETLVTKHNLAQVLNNQGKYEEAKHFYEDVLKTESKILGTEHPDTLITRNNLAQVMYNQGQYEEAERYHNHLLQLRIKLHGANHPNTLRTKHCLAEDLHIQGYFQEAHQLYTEVLQTRINILGPSHPDTLVTKTNIALVLNDQGKYNEAHQLYSNVLQVLIKTLGGEHPYTLRTIHGMAQVFYNQGNVDDAQQLYQNVLQKRIKNLGLEHPATLTTKHSLAEVFCKQGKFEEAQKVYTDVLQARIKILRSDHPHTLATKRNLERIICRQPINAEQ